MPHDAQLLEACRDVMVRFRAHGSYKGEKGAIEALRRRTKVYSPEECRSAFEMVRAIYDRAVDAIGRHRLDRPDKRSRYAEPEDIDFDACLAELDEIEPGSAMVVKRELLTWVIYWYYSK